jgi:hypothetical protein
MNYTKLETILYNLNQQSFFRFENNALLNYPLFNIGMIETSNIDKFTSELSSTTANEISLQNLLLSKQNKVLIVIRKIGLLNTYDNVISLLPNLSNICNKNIPVFTYNLANFSKSLPLDNSAIEGGPCLFGIDEVYFKVSNCKKSHFFDLMNLMQNNETFTTFIEFCKEQNNSEIEIFSNCDNDKIPLNIYIELLRLLILAKSLNLPLVIGLPDFGYTMFVRNIINCLGLQEDLVEKYTEIINNRINLLVSLINKISLKLDINNFYIYYSSKSDNFKNQIKNYKEKLYLKSNKISKFAYKIDSVIDYITLIALPSIIFNKQNIIEINTILEIEAFKKAKQYFKHLNFSFVMFPLLPNTDNSEAMFYSINKNKIYVSLDNLENILIENDYINYQIIKVF